MTISALAYKVAGDMNGLEDLEQWLSDCYDKKEVFGYKHVIVDEGQDFGLLGVDDSANEDSSYGCQIIDILELVALGNGGRFIYFVTAIKLFRALALMHNFPPASPTQNAS